MKRTIVLVEPICRGSRLQMLYFVTVALQDRYNVIIFSREDCETAHFIELMSGLHYELRKVSGDFDGEWLPHLFIRDWRRYIVALRLFDQETIDSYDLFFMALDDYFQSFTCLMFSVFTFRNIERCLTIKYRVSCLTASFWNIREWGIGLLMRLFCRLWRIQTIILDERLEGMSVGGRKVLWLPDPWLGDFSKNRFQQGRELLNYNPNDFVALVIGKQDARKGFPFLLNVLPDTLNLFSDIQVCVCGKIDWKYREAFFQLQLDFKGRIKHIDEFIPEQQLPAIFAMASVVLMPYAPFFTSSSGVLPRAAASEVPVISTEHGLVGERVRRYDLGERFPYGDQKKFLEALMRLKMRLESKEFKQGCKVFSTISSKEAFENQIKNIF